MSSLQLLPDDCLRCMLRQCTLKGLRSLLVVSHRLSGLAYATMRSQVWLHDPENAVIYPLLWHESHSLRARAGPYLCGDSIRFISRHASQLFTFAGVDGEAKLIDVDAGVCVDLDLNAEALTGAFDGKYVVASFFGDATCKAFEVAMGECVWALPARAPDDTLTRDTCIAWVDSLLLVLSVDDDENRFNEVVGVSEGTLRLWEPPSSATMAAPTLKTTVVLPGSPDPEARLFHDFHLAVHAKVAVVVSGTGSIVYCFALPSLDLLHMINLTDPQELCRDEWSKVRVECPPACQGGRMVLGRSDGVAHVWSLLDADPRATEMYLDVHGGTTEEPSIDDSCVCISAVALDGNVLATCHGSFGGFVQIHSISPIRHLRTLFFEDGSHSMAGMAGYSFPELPFRGPGRFFGLHMVLDGSRLMCTVDSERDEKVNSNELWGDWLVTFDAYDVYHPRP